MFLSIFSLFLELRFNKMVLSKKKKKQVSEPLARHINNSHNSYNDKEHSGVQTVVFALRTQQQTPPSPAMSLNKQGFPGLKVGLEFYRVRRGSWWVRGRINEELRGHTNCHIVLLVTRPSSQWFWPPGLDFYNLKQAPLNKCAPGNVSTLRWFQ